MLPSSGVPRRVASIWSGVPTKRWFTYKLHDVISQKNGNIRNYAVRISYSTRINGRFCWKFYTLYLPTKASNLLNVILLSDIQNHFGKYEHQALGKKTDILIKLLYVNIILRWNIWKIRMNKFTSKKYQERNLIEFLAYAQWIRQVYQLSLSKNAIHV
jgi:hypothetical protein